ncbi:MAG TPA: hypothetical protein VE861_08480, partial [Gemmatimonadaceae bacterium]|nr:hypothetical protein [Gemmatimonadaceae bacterium]
MTLQMILLAAMALLAVWFLYRRTVEVPATIDLEATSRELHAHVVLEGIEVNEGDEVLVHNAPTHIPLNEVRTMA